jgi:RNA polymerase sigma-70 factor (ECF subfamily)
MLTDETLEEAMERYARGEDGALARVYDLAATPLFAFLVRLTRSRSLAEDLAHDTFLRVHGARGTYHAGARVMPWMFAIARRLFLDDVRRHRRDGPSLDAGVKEDEPRSDPGFASPEPLADELAAAEELSEQIEGILAKMPETQSTAFRLLKQEELSVAEAAAVLGTTEMTVKLRAHRAYEALRKALGPRLAEGV